MALSVCWLSPLTLASQTARPSCSSGVSPPFFFLFFFETGLLKIVMLFGCVFFKGLFLRCHSSKMPKGIFSLKNHLWAKPKCGVMDPERTFWIVTSGWKQALVMEVGFFLLLQMFPIVNFLTPSLNSDSRWALFLCVPGRAGWVTLFCSPFRCCVYPFISTQRFFKILPEEQGVQGVSRLKDQSHQVWTKRSGVWQTWVWVGQLLTVWQY